MFQPRRIEARARRAARETGERDDIESRILIEQEAIYKRWLLEDPVAAEEFRRKPQIVVTWR